ncbi:MAG: ArnT family glycosyltransferase [Halobacteriaceae archaeon]
MTPRRFRGLLLGLAVGAAGLALVVKYWVFPYHSLNHDEAVYLQQAALFVEGQLVLDPPVADAFRPWFFVDGGAVLYPKYGPLPAGVYAAAKLLTGTYVAALPVIAAGLVVGTGLLGAAVLDRRTGVVAAALLLASPMFVVHTGVFLPYAFTAALEVWFAWAFVRGEQTGDLAYAVAAGGLIGVAFLARPFTAVLFGAPFIGYVLARIVATTGDRSVLYHHGVTALLGLVGVGAALGYNWVLTGSPLLFPYQAFAPLDGIGFGRRALLGYSRDYDLALALASNLVGLRLYATQWVVGGILGTGLAIAGVVAHLRSVGSPTLPRTYAPNHGATILVGVGTTVIVGNLAFWGTLNAVGDLSDPGGLATFLGPYYHFDLLIPTVVFAAATLLAGVDRVTRVARSVPRPRVSAVVAVVVVVALLGSTVVVVGDALHRNRRVTGTYTDAYAPVEGERPTDAVVFVPTPYGPWLNHPFQVLRNDPGFDGSAVYALRETNTFAVVEAFPQRDLYRYVYRGLWAPGTGAAVTARLTPVTTVSADSVTIPVTIGVPSAYESVSLRLGTTSEQTLYAMNLSGDTATFQLVLTPAGARLTGAAVTRVQGPPTVPIAGEELEVRAFLDTGTGAGFSYRLDVPVRRVGDAVQVLTPYREVCLDPRMCGGGAAAIPAALPPGVFIDAPLGTNTSVAGVRLHRGGVPRGPR